ncbi:HAD family hydrolase [uncultured Corynebacterium sp.]|uniref:HAD family hydrolase n=1 Tax=uncultured Corynebacterium sp. TaxID=159447 RepID=UPI0025D3B610|nr:HAD family hydrolase [uncultured Corynebacterium sp.]
MTNVTQHQEPRDTSGEKRVLAIFDLDKTIIDTSASLAYRRPMAERGLLNTSEVLKMMAMLGNYMFTTHSEDSLESTKEALTRIIKDRESEPLRQVAQDALQEVITPFIYAEARELIEWHREQGHSIAIVTASASIMVQPIAKELGADHLFATELEEKDGRFTGAVTHFNKGHAKVERIRELVAEHGYDLDESYAYSDAATDIPMLELVGNPVAVNPDRPLKKRATEESWPIKQFNRPEPLFPQAAVIAGAGATLALLGIAATGLAMWWRGRDEDA